MADDSIFDPPDDDPYAQPDPYGNDPPDTDQDTGQGYELSEPVAPDPATSPPLPLAPPPPMGPGAKLHCQSCGQSLMGATLGGNCPRCGAPVVALNYIGGQSSGKAVASLVLGIVSIPTCMCCGLIGVITGPLAIMFGKQTQNDIKAGTASPTAGGMARAGIICGIIGTILSALSLVINCVIQILSFLANP